MNTTSVVKESTVEDDNTRSLKVLEIGAKTAGVISDFGEDSVPVKDMIALYSKTSESGDSFVVGYLNKNQISKPGEKRIFSLKEDGSESFTIHLKTNGTCEIGKDPQDFAVRYNQLELGFNKLVTEVNALVSVVNANAAIFNTHVHVPTLPTVTPTTAVAIPASANISAAKIETVKVP